MLKLLAGSLLRFVLPLAGTIVLVSVVSSGAVAQTAVLRLIHEIQGSGPSVAITGPVIVQAVVTSLFERDDVLDGFFVQEEDADSDADAQTSEGIFVFCRGNCAPVAIGDQVTVTGEAMEFFGMSQIDVTGGSITVDSSGNPPPSATAVDLPAAGSTAAEATFESVEGMVVTFVDELVVSEYFQLARFGQVILTETDRPFQFTHLDTPSVAGFAAFSDDLATRRIILDDDNNDQNDAIAGALDEAYPYPSGGFSTTNHFRGGDSITGLTGVMHWSFAGAAGTDAWRVRPMTDVVDYSFASANPRPLAPTPVGGSLKVASFNVLNYFTTLDGNGPICGPSGSLVCRGADSFAELTRQRDKIVAALLGIDADIVGLVEIENSPSESVEDLVEGLNAVAGAGAYAFVDTGAIGTDAIKVAFIYQPATASPIGPFAILDSSVDPRFIDTKNRPVLIQSFEEVASGERFTVAVNHLKSKGSSCNDLGDPDLGDGQANCNLTRTDATAALADYLATDPTGSGDGDFIIIGDLNAYAMEDPISALTDAGYVDLVAQFGGAGAYGFVFDGQRGYLDHALANTSLAPQISGTAVWNINADEVGLLDYNDEIRDSGEASFERESNALDLFDADPYRSSDHDPIIIGLNLVAGNPIEIDIKPDSDVNPINPFAQGVIPVAILGSGTFDVFEVASDTLAFGIDGAALAHPKGPHYDDVNVDGFTDLLGHFNTQESGIVMNDTEACLTGELLDATPFESCDDITTVPACGIGFELALLLPPLMWVHRQRSRRIH